MNKIQQSISFLLLFFAIAVFVSCENEIVVEEFESAAVDFSYQSTSIHYVIGENINFTNQSLAGDAYQWDFGDGNTSTEQNPVHKYTQPGTYKVKLTVAGSGYSEKTIMISDIIPIVSYASEDGVIVYNQSEVKFDVQLLNPENQTVVYQWSFPAGTTGEGIDVNGKSSEESPEVVFGAIGSQNVTLKILLGDKELAPISINVKVNYDKPVKTLFYAVKGGNIMSRKLIYDDIDQSINNPFNLGYRSGKHPLTLDVAGDWVYVFDAGTRIGYSDTGEGLGDGELFVVAVDGSKRESVVENFGGNTYYDFYYGFVDEESNMLYWTDRREGVFRVSTTTRNRKFSLNEFSYFVTNNRLGYYGKGIYWGNINGPFTKLGKTFWWAKNTTGAGVFRFYESDIKAEAVSAEEPVPEAGAILGTFTVRGMAIDEVNGRVYIASQSHKSVFCFDMDGKFIKLVDNIGADDGEGGTVENLFITGMDIDIDESGNGYLYYAYRGPDGAVEPKYKSGIKRYKLNSDSATPEMYIEGVEAYGIAIDHKLR
jgi:PKD repeat protein